MNTQSLISKLNDLYGTTEGRGGTFTPLGMAVTELEMLCCLVADNECCRALEIGMAHGTSTVSILHGMEATGGRLISIDPFQNSMCKGKGLEMVRKSEDSNRHSLIEEPDFLALPQLVRDGKNFDFIFIDGDHSQDFTSLDFFYADLLLNDGGIVAFHDTSLPGVFAVTQWLEQSKPYDRLSPRPRRTFHSWFAKLARRMAVIAKGEMTDFEARRTRWRTLAAYRKQSPQLIRDDGMALRNYVESLADAKKTGMYR